MEASSRTDSNIADDQKRQPQPLQEQQKQVQTAKENQRTQQEGDRSNMRENEKKRTEEEKELIDEYMRLRRYATHTRVVATIDRELQALGYDISTLPTTTPRQPQSDTIVPEKHGALLHQQQQQDLHKAKDPIDASSKHQTPSPRENAGLQPVYQQPIKLSSGPSADDSGASAPVLSLTSFAWNQTADAIKLYVKVPGVEKLPRENIRMHTGPRTIELEFTGVENKNFAFAQKPLSNPIDPDRCSYRVKRDMVVVTLRKASPTWWVELSQKRSAKSNTPKYDENADPGASILAMMKNLYEEGDDEMKRMIAKSWTQSQEEKLGGGGRSSAFADMNF